MNEINTWVPLAEGPLEAVEECELGQNPVHQRNFRDEESQRLPGITCYSSGLKCVTLGDFVQKSQIDYQQ